MRFSGWLIARCRIGDTVLWRGGVKWREVKVKVKFIHAIKKIGGGGGEDKTLVLKFGFRRR